MRYIYQNELDKACFQNHMTYGNFKNLPERTAVDKVLRDDRGIDSMVYNFFSKKSSGVTVKSEIMPKEHLTEELHKAIIWKTKSKLIFYRKCLGCWSCRYTNDKQI